MFNDNESLYKNDISITKNINALKFIEIIDKKRELQFDDSKKIVLN